MQKAVPDQYVDVGIAEQHAVTLAAGMACEGLRPVVAIYSTFLQRAYDQLIHDVGIQKLPVTFVLGSCRHRWRRRPDPPGSVRHQLHAGYPQLHGDGAEG